MPKKKVLTGWMIGSLIDMAPRHEELFNPCHVTFCSERCHKRCVRGQSCTLEEPNCENDREKIIYGKTSCNWRMDPKRLAPRGQRRHAYEVEQAILKNHARLMLSKCGHFKITVEQL